jgi:hypothetical protein
VGVICVDAEGEAFSYVHVRLRYHARDAFFLARMLGVMAMTEGPHLDRLREAIAVEGRGQRALLAGDPAAAEALTEAARLYRASWELAPPGSYGRLIGMLKAAVLAGAGEEEARYALVALTPESDSPPAAYARAVALLILGEDDGAAAAAAQRMRDGAPPFGRAADAIVALAARDGAAYAAAIDAIVADFSTRTDHLTGVPIADTAAMLERLAEARGVAARPVSALLPARAAGA